jgi:hypothetical protein
MAGEELLEADHGESPPRRRRRLHAAGWSRREIVEGTLQVVGDVVVDAESDQDQIGLQAPAELLEEEELVRGAIAADAPVDDLDPGSGTVVQGSLQTRREKVRPGNLKALGVRIAEHEDAQASGRLRGSYLGAAKAQRVDRDVGAVLLAKVRGPHSRRVENQAVRPQPTEGGRHRQDQPNDRLAEADRREEAECREEGGSLPSRRASWVARRGRHHRAAGGAVAKAAAAPAVESAAKGASSQ